MLIVVFLFVSAGEALNIDESPATYASRKENVDQVLHFMAAQRIKMRQISSKGIVLLKHLYMYMYVMFAVDSSLLL